MSTTPNTQKCNYDDDATNARRACNRSETSVSHVQFLSSLISWLSLFLFGGEGEGGALTKWSLRELRFARGEDLEDSFRVMLTPTDSPQAIRSVFETGLMHVPQCFHHTRTWKNGQPISSHRVHACSPFQTRRQEHLHQVAHRVIKHNGQRSEAMRKLLKWNKMSLDATQLLMMKLLPQRCRG